MTSKKPSTLGPGGYLVAAGLVAATVAVILVGSISLRDDGEHNYAAAQALAGGAAFLILLGVIMIAGERARRPHG